MTVSVDVNGATAQVTAATVESAFFAPGAAALLGRIFTDEEYETGSAAAVILSEPFWADTMSGEPDVIGTSLEIDGDPHQIVGVMPRGFDTPDGVSFWVPTR